MTEESKPDEPDSASSRPDEGEATGAVESGPDGAPPPRRGGMTVTDYERAMTERSQHARARGLDAPYIRLLVLMIAGIIIGAFALSIIGLIVLGNAAPA